MIFWLLALIVTAVACAALYYAGVGRRVNATAAAIDSPEIAHLRQQLREIESDTALGRLDANEAVGAKAELARELMRVKAAQPLARESGVPRHLIVGGAVALTAALTFGIYTALGRPDLPAMPLSARADVPPADFNLEDAIAKIETRLKQTPDDLRGWTVIAPAYMRLGRFADAAGALRHVIELDGATADRETDLGEALMMQNQGNAEGEPLELFKSAAARDPAHIRSRYYIASEDMRAGRFEEAKAGWEDLLKLAKGDEPWVATARAGLEAASNGGASADAGPAIDQNAIKGMVEGLSSRLKDSGGTIEEWTRLVRSRLVLGQKDKAQEAYDAARAAYPDAKVRTELDVLAADNGLVASN